MANIPEGAELCPECRGRGHSFNRENLSLDSCKTCEGDGYVIENIDKELELFLMKTRGDS